MRGRRSSFCEFTDAAANAARARDGPGGWVILDEPELHFGNDVLVPDLAGWRRERLPAVPDERLHDARAGLDLRGAVAVHRDASIAARSCASTHAKASRHAWLVEPAAANARSAGARVGKVDSDRQRTKAGVSVRAPPFDAIELELGALWI